MTSRSRSTTESLEARTLFAIPIAGTTLGVWETYPTLTAELNTIHNAFPSLTQLVSIGKTVQNRDIWAMRITDNPTIEENEPEFLYQGSMHGDETVGMELSFYFMQYLLDGYGGGTGDGPRVTNLVNNMDIWIVPNLNWDGYSRSPSAWRYNANGVDLNRNFPEWVTTPGGLGNMFDGPAPSTSGRQVETIAMMNFRKAHNFVAGANLHGGELVVNYPWDTNNDGIANYAATPEDGLLRELSLTYSRQNSPMYTQVPFPQGITNGDDWYEITGGMQDWAYVYTGSNDVTIELGYTKFPAASTMPTQWANNRESMLQFMEASNWGVRGVISRSTDGIPLAAKITVVSPTQTSPTPDPRHPTSRTTFSDGDVGDYHRMLLPGTYSLRFEAPGYQTQTISNVVVSALTPNPNATVQLNVAMVPNDTVAPSVLSSQFAFNPKPNRISFGFSENVGPSIAAGDLLLQNLTTSETFAGTQLAVAYNGGTNTADFTTPGVNGGVLPDGNYLATLPQADVRDAWGNPLARDGSLSFFAFAGDANHDRTVNLDDFTALAANFGTSGVVFSQGDFNYDGSVNLDDFTTLAGKFGQSLPAARQSPAAQVAMGPQRLEFSFASIRTAVFSRDEILPGSDSPVL